MSVKIITSSNLIQMPKLDYTIDINNVQISLSTTDMMELIDTIGDEVASDYKKAVEVRNKYFETISAYKQFKKDISELFHIDFGSHELSNRELLNPDISKELQCLINKYDVFLGVYDGQQ